MPMNPRLLRPTQGGFVSPDADARAYLAAVRQADGANLEPAVANAISDFVIGCKQDGIWNAIKASCILAGARTLSGALVPLVGAAPTNVNFVSGDYNRKTGLLGNGATKRLDSNRAGSADPQNSKHLAMYIGETGLNTVFSNTMCDGQNGSGETVCQLSINPNILSLTTRLNTETADASALYSGVGFYGVSRNNATSYLVRGSSTSATVTRGSETPNTANTGVFMRTKNPSAGTSQFYDGRLSFYSIGEAIDLALLDTRVSALITAIDGAIP